MYARHFTHPTPHPPPNPASNGFLPLSSHNKLVQVPNRIHAVIQCSAVPATQSDRRMDRRTKGLGESD